jgi:sugar phosphate isomerase/epimerase
MRTISLDHLTVLGVSPSQFVDIAAELGYDAIGPIATVTPGFPLPIVPLRHGDAQTLAMAARLAATGVRVNNVDGFPLMADSRVESMQHWLDVAAELGARNVVTLLFDPDPGRGLDNFCKLAESARDAGLGLMLEFFCASSIPSLGAAVDFLRRAGQPSARVLIDALHLNQSGGTPDDVRNTDATFIGSAQICDGLLQVSAEQYLYNALNERQIPGTGELPLVEFLAALPPGVPVGVEVPLKSLVDQGVTHHERARRCLEATRSLIEASETLLASGAHR